MDFVAAASLGSRARGLGLKSVDLGLEIPFDLPLVSREWKNGSNSSYNYTPFLHSLLTKGKSSSILEEP